MGGAGVQDKLGGGRLFPQAGRGIFVRRREAAREAESRSPPRSPPTGLHRACAVGALQPSRLQEAARLRLARPLRLGTGFLEALPTSAGGNGLGVLPRQCVPASPASLWGPRFPRGRRDSPPSHSGFPWPLRRRPPRRGPHTSRGDLRATLRPHCHEKTCGPTLAGDRAARNGRGSRASSVAETPDKANASLEIALSDLCEMKVSFPPSR